MFVQPGAAHDPSRPMFRRPGDPVPPPASHAGQAPPLWGAVGGQPGQPPQSLWADPASASHAASHPGYGPGAGGGVYGTPPAVASASGGFGLPPEDPVRPWPWWIALVGLAMAIGSIIAAGLVLGGILTAVKGGDTEAVNDYDYLFGIVQDVLWVAVAIGVPLMIVRWIRPEHLGLRSQPLGWSLLKAFLVLIGFYVVAAIYAGVMGLDDSSNQLLQDTGFGETLGKDIAYAILYPIAAPVAEELLFRGILFKGLRDGFRARMGRGAAVMLGALISGVIFGSAHLGGGQDDFIPVLIALGVLLALAYEWSGTIYVPIAIHAVNNAIATASSADPTADWIFAILAVSPVVAVLVAMGLARFVRRLRSEPPAALPPFVPGPPQPWSPGGPPSGRPPLV